MAANTSRIVFQSSGPKHISLTYEEPEGDCLRAVGHGPGTFALDEIKGDLFGSPASASLAHCVSADMRLGAGIAKLFKAKFGGIADLKSQEAKTGGLAVLQRDERFIYNLVTKDKYSDRPTYSTVKSSLRRMRTHCEANGVTHVCMPRIGCGLDGLEWTRVLASLKEVLAGTDIRISVYTQ